MKRLAKLLLVVLLIFPFFVNINNGMIDSNNINNYCYVDTNEFITVYESITGTVYHPVESQTDNTPLLTADHTKLNLETLNSDRIVALSRNLIFHNDSVRKWDGIIPFGSEIFIESDYSILNGMWRVHDTMNKRYTANIDFIQNHNDPNSIYGKWENIKIKIMVTKRTYYYNNIPIKHEIINTNRFNLTSL